MQRSELRRLYWDAGQFFQTPHDRRPDYMLDVSVYVDESQHVGAGHVVVSGFCGVEEQWRAFAPAWKIALGKKRGLHMKELRWNGRGAEKRVRDWLATLGAIPHHYGLKPIYGAIETSDYSDILAGESELQKKLCGYLVCLSVIFACLTTRLPGHAKIKIICERQRCYESLARALFESYSTMVAKDPRNPFFSGIEFIPKNYSALTQPADFLSFAMTKFLDQRGTRKDAWCRPIFGGIRPDKIDGRCYDRKRARWIISSMKRNIKTGHRIGAVEFGAVLRNMGFL